ncbi:hypothetical protein HYALB_00010390 [Hymenoscyphus albidus]|uniref:Uncharacterized protein n=1 Tax=Hymenoscyphus albidus TaxID=595503 RepID=A0A9N9LRY1_9HELO|nr:hypothetical protein HYALB_00010390 [Hymenoscyphus albidus]
MRSQLTRSVFRRLLSTEGLTFPCPSQSALHLRLRPRVQSSRHLSPDSRRPQRRTFFDLLGPAERRQKEPVLDPGFEKLAEFSKLRNLGARLPLDHELVDAWDHFFRFKIWAKQPVNSLQAMHVLQVFEYLRDKREHTGSYLLNSARIIDCLVAFSNHLPADYTTHLKIAKRIHEELESRGADQSASCFPHVVAILCAGGETATAQQMVKDTKQESPRVLLSLADGYVRENNETELLEVVKRLESIGSGGARWYHKGIRKMVRFYASQNDLEATKKWVSKSFEADPFMPAATLRVVLDMCIRRDELEWCKEVFRHVIDNGPVKTQWDVVFQWASGALGKGVEDVERMMKIMSKQEGPDGPPVPDIDTINGLVERAMANGDSYLAERYIALGAKYNIYPNARTYILQINYRLDAGDLSGSQVAYNSLQSEEIIENEDLPVINRYLRVLCLRPNTYDRVNAILSDLEPRSVPLQAQTTSAIALMFLKREDTQDVFDILQTNAYHYTLPERASIMEKLVEFCLDRRNSNAKAWNSYQVLRQLFDEADTTLRTKLMREFFARGRSDMACYAFGHMRQHAHATRKPNLETYVACFEGIASCEDAESLEMVHNMLRMDSSIEPNTQLYNSLMLAHLSIGKGDRALDFWDDITNSIEGPSYRSLEIVFRACQMSPFGEDVARDTWARLKRLEIEIKKDVFQAYCGALSARGKVDEVRDLMQSGEKDYGIRPDGLMLGVFYNAMPGQNRKDMIEEWARATYPEAWRELQAMGQTTIDGGFVKKFLIRLKWKA